MTDYKPKSEMEKRYALVGAVLKSRLGDDAPGFYGGTMMRDFSFNFPHLNAPESTAYEQYDKNVLCLSIGDDVSIDANAGKIEEDAEKIAALKQKVSKTTSYLEELGIPYRALGSDPETVDDDLAFYDSLEGNNGYNGISVSPENELSFFNNRSDGYTNVEGDEKRSRTIVIAIELGDNPEAVLDKFRPDYAIELKKELQDSIDNPQETLDRFFSEKGRKMIATLIEVGGEEVKPVIKEHLEALRKAASSHINTVIRDDLGLAPSLASRATISGAGDRGKG